MRPTASVGDIKIRLGGGGDYRVKQGLWYAPALVQKSRAETAAAAGAGKAPAATATWASHRTAARHAQRRTVAAQKRAAQHGERRGVEFPGSGEDSDGLGSVTSGVRRSSVAQGAGGSSSGAAAAPGGGAVDSEGDLR